MKPEPIYSTIEMGKITQSVGAAEIVADIPTIYYSSELLFRFLL